MTAIEIPTPTPTPDPRSFDEASRPFAEAVSPHYAIKRMIGRGGMGVVYLARDRRLERLVAIKTLPPQLAADAAVRERFLRETRTAGAMAHPNIVPIHGADEIDGHVFFVMAYIEGESLAAHTRANGQLEPRLAGGYLRDVAAALAHAHARGIVHRDIKGENILIERSSGRALVTDFGIARLAQAAPLTATGQILGTVHYVSPEQVSGEPVDARSDIYSLGVVGFFALTGRFPFDAELASAVLVAHVTRPAPSVRSINRDVPAALAAIVDRCLAKNPAQRYESADDLLAALEAALADPDRTAKAGATATRVSDTEAHALWQRAADLQASTGIVPRPEPVPRARDVTRDRARSTGFAVDDVRIAASEAGIDERYVEHALVEHGLAPGRPARSGTDAAVRGTPRPSFWAGIPLDIVKEIEIKGELPAREFDRLINVIRDRTGRLGKTAAKTRELAWRGGAMGSSLEVSVVPDQGHTTIRLASSGRRSAVAAIGGTAALVAGGGAPLAAVLLRQLLHIRAPSWGIILPNSTIDALAVSLGVGVALVAAVRGGRAVARWLHRQRDARVAALADALGSVVRDRVS